MTRLLARLLAVSFSLIMCCAAPTVQAEDLSQTGSLTIQMLYNQQPIAGGDILIYQVARAIQVNGDATYELLPAFAAAGDEVSFAHLDDQNAVYAQTLSAYRSQAQPVFQAQTVPATGISVTGLEKGLYLLVQETAADGYEVLNPFLVTIPKDGQYSVQAFEKMSPIVAKTPTVTSDSPTKSETELPFTGQLWWPAPLLMILGASFWLLSFRTKRKG